MLLLAVKDDGSTGGCKSGSLVTEDVGETITDRPVLAPRDSGLSPSRDPRGCRDRLGDAATCGDDAEVLDDDP